MYLEIDTTTSDKENDEINKKERKEKFLPK